MCIGIALTADCPNFAESIDWVQTRALQLFLATRCPGCSAVVRLLYPNRSNYPSSSRPVPLLGAVVARWGSRRRRRRAARASSPTSRLTSAWRSPTRTTFGRTPSRNGCRWILRGLRARSTQTASSSACLSRRTGELFVRSVFFPVCVKFVPFSLVEIRFQGEDLCYTALRLLVLPCFT